MMLLKKIQKLKIVDRLLVLGFLLVILGIGMNFKDQFLTKEEVRVVSKNIGSTTKSDIQVNSEVMIDI